MIQNPAKHYIVIYLPCILFSHKDDVKKSLGPCGLLGDDEEGEKERRKTSTNVILNLTWVTFYELHYL